MKRTPTPARLNLRLPADLKCALRVHLAQTGKPASVFTAELYRAALASATLYTSDK